MSNTKPFSVHRWAQRVADGESYRSRRGIRLAYLQAVARYVVRRMSLQGTHDVWHNPGAERLYFWLIDRRTELTKRIVAQRKGWAK